MSVIKDIREKTILIWMLYAIDKETEKMAEAMANKLYMLNPEEKKSGLMETNNILKLAVKKSDNILFFHYLKKAIPAELTVYFVVRVNQQ